MIDGPKISNGPTGYYTGESRGVRVQNADCEVNLEDVLKEVLNVFHPLTHNMQFRLFEEIRAQLLTSRREEKEALEYKIHQVSLELEELVKETEIILNNSK